MKNSLRIHKWTHNEFNIFILGVLTHPLDAVFFIAVRHLYQLSLIHEVVAVKVVSARDYLAILVCLRHCAFAYHLAMATAGGRELCF